MTVLVSDTSVIIDLERGELLESVFQLAVDFAVPDLLFHRELAGPLGDRLLALGLRVEELSPGEVQHRVIRAPGLRPLFLIGDDERSRAWLQQRQAALRELGAVGLVVNVESAAALAELRRLAAGLILSPASGDDLAQRLGLRHYPVLITSTGVEQ